MSESELPGQLPPRRSRVIRRPASQGPGQTGEPSPALEGAPSPGTASSAAPGARLESGSAAPLAGSSPARSPDSRAERALGPAASASRAAFPSRRQDPVGDAPILRVPPSPPSRTAGPILAVVLGLGLLGGALALAWPSGSSARQLATVVTPAPTATPAPAVVPAARTPERPVYNPWANGQRPPVRRIPRPVAAETAAPETPEPVPEPSPPARPVRSVPTAQPVTVAPTYPQARPKPTPAPLNPVLDPFANPDPYYSAPALPAAVPSKSLSLKVTAGVVIGGSEPLKAYSLSLLVHNRSQERVERLRVVLRRGEQSYDATNFDTLEPGQRQELQLSFAGIARNFHPQRLEVHWSTITGDFVTDKGVSDAAWTKVSAGY